MASVDQNGLHDRRPVKEQEGDPNSKAETEVNFKEEEPHKKKKTYGRTPDGTGMSYTYCLRMLLSIVAQFLGLIRQLPSQPRLYATVLFYKS